MFPPLLIDQRRIQSIFHIKTSQGCQTALLVQKGRKRIFVTASHGISNTQNGESIYIEYNSGWKVFTVANVVHNISAYDVSLFELDEITWTGLEYEELNSDCFVGQDCLVAGYPLLLGSRNVPEMDDRTVALFKRATFSGFWTEAEQRIFLFDCLINRGFSGGPIFSIDSKIKEIKVLGFVQGWKNDQPQEIQKRIKNNKHEKLADHLIYPNSGIMKAVPSRVVYNALEPII